MKQETTTRPFNAISPDGTIYENLTSVTNFALQHRLSIFDILLTLHKYSTNCNGWKFEYCENP